MLSLTPPPPPRERERRDGKETEIEERSRKRESSDTKYFMIQKTRSGSICYMQKQPPWLGKRVRYTDYNTIVITSAWKLCLMSKLFQVILSKTMGKATI